tara:strand:- start:1967 stop:3493 length:1527 start_codon:yes stop_codon:yes gene_type:complete
MKKLILTLLVVFFVNLTGNTQCSNGTNYYPSSIYDPTDGVWGSATTCNWAGEVIRINVISGDEYEISTCSGNGGVNASYDTQLTLFDEGGIVVGFNDDYTGCSGYTSYIKWTAGYTGVLYIHLNQYNCATNQTCTEVMILRTAGSGGGSLDYTEVGNSASTTNDGRVPTYGYYDYSWSASIYGVDDLGPTPIIIDKVSYDVTNGISTTMSNQSIFMAYTDELEFISADSPEDGNGPWDNWIKVFEGDVTWEYGWNEITLDQSFYYDGNRGIIIKWVNNDGSWSSSYPSFRYTSRSNTVVYNYNDGAVPPTTGYINSYKPNMRFNHGGSALPIDLISFNGEIVGNNVELNWSVASQVNNDYFTIKKSIDCEQWEEVSVIPGAGNSNTEMNYTIYDENPYDGVSYYRLTQTDYDGESETFSPISVIYDKPIILSINPNPVREELHLYLEETLRGTTNLTILNTKGQKVYKKSFIGEYKVLHLDVGNYKKGYYLLEIDHNQRKGTLKFVKE